MAAPMYNVFVGSETGLLKGINVGKNTWGNVNAIESADKQKEIVSMCWGDASESSLCVGTKNHHLLNFEIESCDFKLKSELSLDCGKGDLRGIARLEENYVTCVKSGHVKLWENESVASEFNAGEDIFCFCQNESNPRQFATGGKENDLKLWDISSPKEPLFQAKNVKNDWLDLRVPVWVLGAQFLPGNKVVTSTGYHQVRVYDPQAQRRPIMDISFYEYPITALAICPYFDNQVVVGNTQGNMATIDFRTGKTVHVYKGFSGGIRNIVCHKSLPLVASCGLDRHLRIHDLNTKQMIHKSYLKSRLNCILLTRKWSNENNEGEIDVIKDEPLDDVGENSADGDDIDEVWNQMKVVHTKTVRKIPKEDSVGEDQRRRKQSSKGDAPLVKKQKKKK